MIKNFFELSFSYIDDEFANHYFGIGVFNSKEKALSVIQMLHNKPGFVDHKNGFKVKRIDVNYTSECLETEGNILYQLCYEYYNEKDGFDYFTIFGYFSSYDLAYKEQVKLLHAKNKDYIEENFAIYENKEGIIGWVDGFDS